MHSAARSRSACTPARILRAYARMPSRTGISLHFASLAGVSPGGSFAGGPSASARRRSSFGGLLGRLADQIQNLDFLLGRFVDMKLRMNGACRSVSALVSRVRIRPAECCRAFSAAFCWPARAHDRDKHIRRRQIRADLHPRDAWQTLQARIVQFVQNNRCQFLLNDAGRDVRFFCDIR